LKGKIRSKVQCYQLFMKMLTLMNKNLIKIISKAIKIIKKVMDQLNKINVSYLILIQRKKMNKKEKKTEVMMMRVVMNKRKKMKKMKERKQEKRMEMKKIQEIFKDKKKKEKIMKWKIVQFLGINLFQWNLNKIQRKQIKVLISQNKTMLAMTMI